LRECRIKQKQRRVAVGPGNVQFMSVRLPCVRAAAGSAAAAAALRQSTNYSN